MKLKKIIATGLAVSCLSYAMSFDACAQTLTMEGVDLDKIVSYANLWSSNSGKPRNKDYYTNFEMDCCNFTSQCLAEGGLGMIGTQSTIQSKAKNNISNDYNSSRWYSKKVGSTYIVSESWYSTGYFYKSADSGALSSKVDTGERNERNESDKYDAAKLIAALLKKGDVLQLVWKSESGYNDDIQRHNMVVTDVGRGTIETVKLASHTRDYKGDTLKAVHGRAIDQCSFHNGVKIAYRVVRCK